MANKLEYALDEFLEILQTAHRDRALPLVRSLCLDFPVVEQFIFMQPEKMIEYLKGPLGSLLFPNIKQKIAGKEAVIIEKLYDVQKRL